MEGRCEGTERPQESNVQPPNTTGEDDYQGRKKVFSWADPGRVPLRRIENPTSRQITFCKRRNGVLKKAHELSVLCDAEVAVIIFSAKAKLSEFASSNMGNIIDRYQEYIDGKPTRRSMLEDIKYWRHEVIRLQEQVAYLQNLQSCMMGEKSIPLPLKDIENFELILEGAFVKTRERKMQLLQQQAQEMKRQDDLLQEENRLLKMKLAESTAIRLYTPRMSGKTIHECVNNNPAPLRSLNAHGNQGQKSSTESEESLQLGLTLYMSGSG